MNRLMPGNPGRRARLVALSATAALLATSCGNLLDPAAAVVGNQKITLDDVQEATDEYTSTDEYASQAEQGDPGLIQRSFQQDFLAREVRRRILAPEAEERGIEVTDQDVKDALEMIKNDDTYGGSQSKFEEALKESGTTLAQLEQIIYDSEVERALKEDITSDLAPTEAEIEKYYEEHLGAFSETKIAHVLLRDPGQAAQVRRRLGAASKQELPNLFASLAKDLSMDQGTRAKGGVIGYLRQGQFEAFDEAIQRVGVGKLSGVIASESGYHVLLVQDRRPVPLDEVHDTISSRIAGNERDKAWDRWLREAYRDADLKVNPRFGEFDPATQKIVDAPTSGGDGPPEGSTVTPGG